MLGRRACFHHSGDVAAEAAEFFYDWEGEVFVGIEREHGRLVGFVFGDTLRHGYRKIDAPLGSV